MPTWDMFGFLFKVVYSEVQAEVTQAKGSAINRSYEKQYY